MRIRVRISNELYQRAIAEAHRQGLTFSEFVEDALKSLLAKSSGNQKDVELPSFRAGPDMPPGFDLMKLIKREDD